MCHYSFSYFIFHFSYFIFHFSFFIFHFSFFIFHFSFLCFSYLSVRFGFKHNNERIKLPTALSELLEDPNILKVGCNILNDRTKLIGDYDLDLPKEIYINLSTLGITRKVLTKSMSLAELVYHMLGLRLNKPEDIQVSNKWTDVPLGKDQINYAAIDSYAGILVYGAIVSGQDPMFDDYTPAAIEPGKKVNIYDSTGSTVIAFGIVSSQTSGPYRDYRQSVSSSRAIVTISEILLPCALIPIGLSRIDSTTAKDKGTRCTIIEHYSRNQDDLLVNKKNLRPHKETSFPRQEISSTSSSTSSLQPTVSYPPQSDVISDITSKCGTVQDKDFQWNNGIEIDDEEMCEENHDMIRSIASNEETYDDYKLTLPENILRRLSNPPSKVKGDHLHCFKNLGDSMKKKNGAHAAFMRGVSDSFFMVSKGDLDIAEDALKTQNVDENTIAMQKKYQWKKTFLKHCRRSTGSDRLVQLARFDKFIEAFIQIRDAKTKELLITPKTKLKIEATRLAIASGYYTDPAGVNIYREMGRDSLGRMKYACYRGTNALEVNGYNYLYGYNVCIYLINYLHIFNTTN
jgi:3'-5' exonuclease